MPGLVPSFDFGRLPRITFGRGRIVELPAVVGRHGRRALLVTGPRSFRSGPHFAPLMDALRLGGLSVEDLVVEGEPSPDVVDEAVTTFRAGGIEVVVGIGGGSVLDAAKAIAGLLRADTSVLDHLEGVGRGLAYVGPATPFVAVPTTAGTGSEATRNAVLSRVGPGGFKKSFRDEQLVARDAVVDPDLLEGLPPRMIADNGMDALVQLLESYTSTRTSPITDGIALEGLNAARDGLLPWFRAASRGGDAPEARGSMAFAALASGITLAHTGLGAVHGLASPLGARFPIPHGAACGATVVAATRVNVLALEARDAGGRALGRYADVGRVLTGRPDSSDRDARAELLELLESWTEHLGTRGLGSYGVGEGEVAGLVAEARGTSMRTNPVELSDDEVASIVRAAL